jgi:hypothetical protein
LERLSEPVLAVLSELSGSTGWTQDPFADRLTELKARDSTDSHAASSLEGLTVALYSLDESSLRRALGRRSIAAE